jgi:hypothetical protein
MSSPYIGNAAYPPPATVPLPADSDPQRATTYNAAYQALADQIAYQMRLYGPARMGGLSDLHAVSDARLGEIFFVLGYGYYSYQSGALATNSPIVEPATGMGVGAWVSSLWAILFGNGAATNPPKITPALIANSIIKTGELLTTAASITTVTTSSSSFSTLVDSGSHPVAGTITDAKASDALYLWVGPLSVIYGGTGYAEARVKVVRGLATTYYKRIQGLTGYQDFAFRYDIPTDGDINVSLEIASSDGTATHSFASPSDWGPAGNFLWAHYQLVRP